MQVIDSEIINEYSKLTNPVSREFVQNELKKRIVIESFFKQCNIMVDCSEKTINMSLNKFCKQNGINSQDELIDYVRGNRLDKGRLRQMLIYEEKLNILKDVMVSPSDISDFFFKKKQKYEQIEFLSIKVKTKELADNVHSKVLINPECIEDYVVKYSIGKEKQNKGKVGPVCISALHPKIKSKVYSASDGDILDPIEFEENIYVIIKILKFTRLLFNAKTEAMIKDELFLKWLDIQVNLLK